MTTTSADYLHNSATNLLPLYRRAGRQDTLAASMPPSRCKYRKKDDPAHNACPRDNANQKQMRYDQAMGPAP